MRLEIPIERFEVFVRGLDQAGYLAFDPPVKRVAWSPTGEASLTKGPGMKAFRIAAAAWLRDDARSWK